MRWFTGNDWFSSLFSSLPVLSLTHTNTSAVAARVLSLSLSFQETHLKPLQTMRKITKPSESRTRAMIICKGGREMWRLKQTS